MTSKLKCPFCKEEIISDLCLMCDKIDKGYTSGRQIYKCNKCSLFGNKELWQALIQAKQDLKHAEDTIVDLNATLERTSAKYAKSQKSVEIARKALEDIIIVRCGLEDFEPKAVTMTRIAENALEQIEHKE